MNPRTIWDLAADTAFNPNVTGISIIDSKPWGWTPGRSRNVIAHRTRCKVLGCGVPFAPGGVCGYCRHFVKQIRAGHPERVPVKREERAA